MTLASSRRRLLPLAALLLLAAGACFEQPIKERLRLRFLPEGGVRVLLTVDLNRAEDLVSSPAVRDRLAQKEREILEGWDLWGPRFEEAGAAEETFSWKKREGDLVRARRTALLNDPRRLRQLLGDTPIYADYAEKDGVAQLALYPGPSDRASRRERRRVTEALDPWSEAVAAYLGRLEELYRYLETRPHRAEACFAKLLESGEGEGEEELLPEEEGLVEPTAEAMAEVWTVLEVDAEDASSLEEASRRVYDPFPAPLEVAVEAEVLESEGFTAAGKTWRVPGLSLWSALEALEGRWLSPDPLLAAMRHELAGSDEDFDSAALAAQARRVSPSPGGDEVRTALEEGLVPRDVYRLTWRLPGAGTT